MSKLLAILAAVAALAAVPALAQPVQTPVARVQNDAFTAFNGTNGAGGFTYGYTNSAEFGGVVTLGTRGTLLTYLSSKVLTGTTTLFTGQSFGVIIDDNGAYGGDSTSLNFHITTVPEPATWGLMLAGFGMVGFAARRRQSVVAA